MYTAFTNVKHNHKTQLSLTAQSGQHKRHRWLSIKMFNKWNLKFFIVNYSRSIWPQLLEQTISNSGKPKWCSILGWWSGAISTVCLQLFVVDPSLNPHSRFRCYSFVFNCKKNKERIWERKVPIIYDKNFWSIISYNEF